MLGYLMMMPAHALEGLTLEKFQAVWSGWTRSEQAHFHARLLFALDDQSRRVRHSQISRKISSREPSRAPASDSPELCNYAGYLSKMANGVCMQPWNRNLRSQLASASLLHSSYNSCGNSKKIRCNPMLYGFQDEHQGNLDCGKGAGRRDRNKKRGCCVEADDDNPRLSTFKCNAVIFGDDPSGRIRRLLDSMVGDPKRLAEYLGSALVVIENCPAASDECVALQELVQDSLQELNSNEEYSDLLCSLSDGFIDLGLDVELFQRTARALNDANLNRAIDDVFEWRSSREGILQTLIQNYENDSRTQRMARAARQVEATRGGRECYRKVKDHMSGRGKYIRGRWSSEYAINAKEDLAERGFINLAEYGFPLDAEQAPHGSVLVYEALDRRTLEVLDPKVVDGRGAGHVEIVVGNGDRRRYVSDYQSSKPRNQARRDGHLRRLVGIMIYPTDGKLLSDWEQAENYN